MAAEGFLRVGIYVDVANITMNGGRGMRYDVLREFATRRGGEPMRLNAYAAFDEERAREDWEYREKTEGFFWRLRDFGYKVVRKPVRWYVDEDGEQHPKANVDLDMGVDAIMQARSLDRVMLVTGDGDFARVVEGLQNMGIRVEILAFESVSRALRETADHFISGFILPDLLPLSRTWEERAAWGEIGSRVRGTCYRYNSDGGYGFLRYLKHPGAELGPLWVTDTRDDRSPWASAFVHHSQLPNGFSTERLPSRDAFFEFELAPPRGDDSDSPEAVDVTLAGRL